LGDIEAALAEHPNVRQLAVTVWEPRSGDKQLAAYVVPNGKDFSGDELRRYLKARLPEYMVPASMLVLEQLPLTHNGKVDRAALPVPQITGEKNYVAPRSPTEEALCKIWSDVLEVERVGIEDDFFELGGHSLLATRVVSRVRTQMEVDLPLLNLFRATRIGDLSPLVDEALSQRRAARKPRLTRLDRNSYLAK
jgi:acyl carrier protein